MRFPSQAQKKHGNSVFKQKILALFSRGSHHKPKKREIPFSNRRYWHYFPEKPKKTRKSSFQMRFPSQAQKKARKFRFQIEDVDIISQRLPSQAQKKGNPVFKQKILALFSRKAQKVTEIPFSNEVPITSPEKTRKFRFQIEDIDIIFQRLPSQAKKTTEIPFSNRRYWHYFPEVPITSPKKGKSRFQIEDIGIIFQKSPKSHGNPVFKQKLLALFSRGCHHKPKKREIPFSNRRYWHYFPEKPKKSRKSRFQMRFPSQAQKKHGNSDFKQKILILFSRGCHHKPKKQRKSRFQIEDIGIIFQRFPSQAQKKGNPVFKQKILALFSRKAQKVTEIPFSNRSYWHYFPEVAITSQKKGNPVFKQKILALFSRKAQKDTEIPVFK